MAMPMDKKSAPQQKGHGLRSLSYPQFRLYWLGLAVTYTGFWTQLVAQGWLVLRLTDSPFMLGLLMSVGNLPLLLLSLPGGVLADRFDRRKVMLVSRSSTVLLMIVAASLIATNLIQVWHIFVIAFLVTSFDALDIPARQAAIADLVPTSDIVNAMSMSTGVFHGARIIGPAIAGIIIQQIGESGAFVLFALANLIFILLLTFVRIPRSSATSRKSWAIHKDIVEGLSHIKSNKTALPLVVLAALISIFSFTPIALMPAFARNVLGLSAFGLGTLLMALGVGAVAAAIIIGIASDLNKKGAYILLSSLLLGLSLLLFSQTSVFWLSFAALSLYGFFLNSFSTLIMSLLLLTVPSPFHGRVMSMVVLTWGFSVFGSLAAGAIAEAVDTSFALSTAGLYIAACAIGIFILRPSLRRA